MSDAPLGMEAADERAPASSAHTVTEVVDSSGQKLTTQPVLLRLRLQNPKVVKKVGWNADTIDNEGMDKKKSKCCCVFRKEATFGESSSESEDECEHCTGHPEQRHVHKHHHHYHDNNDDPNAGASNTI